MKQKKPVKAAAPEKNPAGSAATHDQIAERARKLWEDRGRPEGRDVEHWLEAERELRQGGGSRGNTNAAGATDDEVEADMRLDGLVQRPRE